MNIFLNILVPILCLILGYIFGSFPSAVVLGKLKYHQDPRDYGSKNSGATNAGRLWGKKACATVIFLDAIKTIIPFLITFFVLSNISYEGKKLVIDAENYWIMSKISPTITQNYVINWPVYYMTCLGCFLGHCYPCFANFKGGKGVTVFLITIFIISWILFIICAILFLIILKIKKTVSLSSLITTFSVTVISFIIFFGLKFNSFDPNKCLIFVNWKCFILDYSLSLILFIMTIFSLVRHRKNIVRLREGKEFTIKWMK